MSQKLESVVTEHAGPVTGVSLASLGGGRVLVLSGSWRQELRVHSHHDKSALPSVRLPRSCVPSPRLSSKLVESPSFFLFPPPCLSQIRLKLELE